MDARPSLHEVSLTAANSPGLLTWYVGDVHGCLPSLQALERRVAQRSRAWGGSPLLVLLGDLIDRGPDSAGVVAHVRAGVAARTHACIMGNHEAILLKVLHDVAPDSLAAASVKLPPVSMAYGTLARARLAPAWLLQFGGAETLRSYGVDPAWEARSTWRLPSEDLQFLAGLPLVHVSDQAVATHALVGDTLGFGIALALQQGRPVPTVLPPAYWPLFLQELLEGREPPSAGPMSGRWHVSGHTPLEQLTRHRAARLVQVDTGAAFGRRLTAWCAELDRYVSVPGAAEPWRPDADADERVRDAAASVAVDTDDWFLAGFLDDD